VSGQSWSRHVVIVRLPPEPQINDELDTVIQVAVNDTSFDIIVDFADVQTISQPSLCRLVILHRILQKAARQLGFCNISHAIRSVFKTHRIGRFIESDWNREISLEPSANPTQGGSLVLRNQDQLETCERRSYVRYSLSKSLRITALLWHRSPDTNYLKAVPTHCWQCILIDVSEGGVQIVIDVTQEPTFHKGQFVNVRFVSVPCEMPVTFDALIREILPTADSEHICLGLQFVGLETNTEGRRSLQHLCDSEGRYFEATAYGTNNMIHSATS
jgi:anti-anti-sigma regulatory factor